MKTTFIYSLKDPITFEIKYIGKANNLKTRLRNHVGKTKLLIGKISNKNISWIKSLLDKGLEPLIEELDVVPYDEWKYWETYWIWQFRSWGFKLKNGTFGGDGEELTEETRLHLRKINTGEKNPMYGRTHSPETRAKISIGNIGKKYSPSVCAKISSSKMGHSFTDEAKEKISNTLKGNSNAKGHVVSKEAREKMSKSKLGIKLDEKYTQRLIGNKFAKGPHKISDEAKARMIAAHKGKKASKETLLKKSNSLKKYWADVKAGIIKR